jgi:glucokinase
MPSPRSFRFWPRRTFESIDIAIQTGVLDKTSLQPRSAILAVAGPIKDNEIDLTNCDWVIRPEAMIRELGFDDVVVINDFEAQALAAASLGQEYLEKVGGGEVRPASSRVVVGPGPAWASPVWFMPATHGFPFPAKAAMSTSVRERPAIWSCFPHYDPIEGRISAEQLLCGRGLMNIYRAVCKADKLEPRKCRNARRT